MLPFRSRGGDPSVRSRTVPNGWRLRPCYALGVSGRAQGGCPRYFFDFHEDGRCPPDNTAVECASMATVCQEASVTRGDREGHPAPFGAA